MRIYVRRLKVDNYGSLENDGMAPQLGSFVVLSFKIRLLSVESTVIKFVGEIIYKSNLAPFKHNRLPRCATAGAEQHAYKKRKKNSSEVLQPAAFKAGNQAGVVLYNK